MAGRGSEGMSAFCNLGRLAPGPPDCKLADDAASFVGGWRIPAGVHAVQARAHARRDGAPAHASGWHRGRPFRRPAGPSVFFLALQVWRRSRTASASNLNIINHSHVYKFASALHPAAPNPHIYCDSKSWTCLGVQSSASMATRLIHI